MTLIQLVNGGHALVDCSDAEAVQSRNWRANFRYEQGRRGDVSAVVSGSARDGTFVMLHRFLMECGDGEVVDHIDGNPLNNCRSNLRACSQLENMRNRKRSRTNRCGFKGVYLDPKSSRFRAEIKVGGKKHCLGSFETPEQAHAAYTKAARKYHGAFARAA